MLRQHDVVVSEGTLRVILTRSGRVLVVFEVPETEVGPLRLLTEAQSGPLSDGRPYSNLRSPPLTNGVVRHPGSHIVGFGFGDIVHGFEHAASGVAHGIVHAAEGVGHGVAHAAEDVGKTALHAAEGTFNAASKVATTLARPALNIVKGATAESMHLLAKATPFIPDAARKQLDAASRIVLRAKLGDLTAKQFVSGVVAAAKAGVHGASHIADTLASGARLVARTIDVPAKLLGKVPVLGGIVQTISPLQKFDKMMGAVQKGDFKGLEHMVKDDLSLAQGIVSLFPGIGTGISAGISAGLAILESGAPLEIAIKTAYGALPIPIGIRTVTDAVLAAALSLAHGEKITDLAITSARSAVPSGFPRDVFDTLVHIILKGRPIVKVAGDLVKHYVDQYAQPVLHSITPNITLPPALVSVAKPLQQLAHI